MTIESGWTKGGGGDNIEGVSKSLGKLEKKMMVK